MKTLLTIILLTLLVLNNIKAQTSYSSNATGNWEDVSTWQIITGYQFVPPSFFIPQYGPATSTPTATDNVTINGGDTVTINSASAVTYVYISSATNANTAELIVTSGNSLTTDTLYVYPVSTGVCKVENNGTISTEKTYLYGSSSTSVAEILNNSTYTTSTTEMIETNAGTISILNNSGALFSTGNVSVSNSNPSNTTIDLSSGNGTLELTGNFSGSNLTLNPGTLGSIVDYNGTSAQTINASIYSFDNLHISNTVGASLDASLTGLNLNSDLTTNLGGVLNLNGNNITILNNINNDGTINADANIDLTGNFISTGTFTSSGSTINIEGDWNNTGTYTYQTGDSVVFDGTVTGSTITGNTDFDELVINQPSLTTTVSSGSVGVASYLTVDAGTLNASSGATVTLLSSGSKTGQLVELVAGADYTGDLAVERDLSVGTDGWREITSPVAGTTLADWQDDGLVFTGFTGAPYNGSNWFSFINTYTYTEANAAGVKDNGWVAATNITNPTSFNNGHRIYTGPTTTGVLSVKGAPNKNSQIANVTFSGANPLEDGWNLIGNPYPCTIDWNSLTKNNIDNTVWIWNGTAGNYGLYLGGAASGTNGVDNEIAHSQAFWVHATAITGSVIFSESDKIRSDKAFVKSNSSEEYVRIKLSGAVNSYYDEAIIAFNAISTESFDAGIDQRKLYTSLLDLAPSLAILTSDNKDLSIAAINELESRSIPLKAYAGTNAYGTYTIEFELPANSLLHSCLTLEDLETGTITNLKNSPSYTFTTTANSPQDRFIIHITNPFETTTFDPTCAALVDGAIAIEGNEVDGNTFTLTNSNGVLQTIAGSGNQIVFEDLESGSYTITSSQVSSCGNSSIDVVLSSPASFIADFELQNSIIYLDDNSTITPTNNSNGDNYTWDFGDGNTSMEQNPTHTYSSPGVYTITLTAEKNGCEVIQYQTIEVKATTSVEEVSNINYSIISNEGSIMINIDNSLNEIYSISITSMNGQNVYNSTTSSNSKLVDTRSFAKGLYLVTIKTDSDQLIDKVFVK